MDFAKIILYAVLTAMGFGFAYEAISAAVCVEYFTLGHRPLVATESPLWLGLQYSFLGWWWVGAALGSPLAIAGRIGGEIQIKPGFFIKPLIALFVLVAFLAITGGAVGHYAEKTGRYPLQTPWAGGYPAEKHAAYVALTWSHFAAYSAALLGSAALIAWTWKKRSAFTRLVKASRAGH